jgi:predicted CXXCH cytochrome family protein
LGGRPSKGWASGLLLGTIALAAAACAATTSHRVLSFFFDGVPAPGNGLPVAGTTAAAVAAARGQTGSEHGPYAAHLCSACHETAASNALVVPRDQLCSRCHDFRATKRYVHGPLASGGCLVCHDPHRSSYGHLLVSESRGFCLRCHERRAIEQVSAHAGVDAECTTCHDAHMSDARFLLR